MRFLASEKFVSLSKVILDLCLDLEKDFEMERMSPLDDSHGNSEIWPLSYVNALFPKFRALTSPPRTLGTHVEII